MSEEIVLKVAAKGLVVSKDGKLLILREAKTYEEGTNRGRFHIPGGRLNLGEKYKDGLQREMVEETGLKVKLGIPVFVGEWFPKIKGVKNHIVAIFSVCYASSTKVKLSSEHDKAECIDPKKRADYDIMTPDWQAVDMLAELIERGLI